MLLLAKSCQNVLLVGASYHAGRGGMDDIDKLRSLNSLTQLLVGL